VLFLCCPASISSLRLPRRWLKGGHFRDQVSVGPCACRESKRFAFDEEGMAEGLEDVGTTFGVKPTDL
jgi:hypothetical protein